MRTYVVPIENVLLVATGSSLLQKSCGMPTYVEPIESVLLVATGSSLLQKSCGMRTYVVPIENVVSILLFTINAFNPWDYANFYLYLHLNNYMRLMEEWRVNWLIFAQTTKV
ncbi:hypothetical protein C6497_03610 [Candidatus Poribacteria bacterium]|nr:MAG: hypothetical protein C6497_03610 [Candidatus Poribacteria bacterium]